MNISHLVKMVSDILTPADAANGAGGAARADEKSGRIMKDFNVASGQKLSVELVSGTLDVKGWEHDVVSIEASLEDGDWRDYDVQLKQDASGILVACRNRDKRGVSIGRLRFEIKVPERFDLEIKHAGGDIRIARLEGRMKGETMGGDMCLSDLKGRIDFTTMGGDISLVGSNVNGKVETMGGQVLIKNVDGDVKAHSMNGNVVYENASQVVATETDDGASEEVVRVSSAGGDVRVDDAPAGAEITCSGGDITIRSAARFVKARTLGGDIRVDAVDGWMEGSTGGGNINVKMNGDVAAGGRRDVALTSNGGDITLTVPAELSMDIEIELAYTRNSKQNYTITTDFDLQEQRTEEWDAGRGTPRKYIHGKGSIAGGRHRIKIKTVNGNVYLNKSS